MRLLSINVYGHIAAVAPIILLRLTGRIQELKFKVKSLKYKSSTKNIERLSKLFNILDETNFFYMLLKRACSQLICY